MEELYEKIAFPFFAKGVEIAKLAEEAGYGDQELIQLLRYSNLKDYFREISVYFLSQVKQTDELIEFYEDFFEAILREDDFEDIVEIDDHNCSVVVRELTDKFDDLVHIYKFVLEKHNKDRISAFGQFPFPYEVITTMISILEEFLKRSEYRSDREVVEIIRKEMMAKAKEKGLMNLQKAKSHPSPISTKVSSFSRFSNDVNEEALHEILTELYSLIGMEDVKAQVEDMMNFIRVQRMRNDFGLRSIPSSYHIVFTGKPGTGKTTVARLIGRLYKEIGILSSGHTVETDRAGLVGEHIGETALKTEAKIQEALGGILLIDEAYALTRDKSGQDFGIEAIDTLVKRMEDYRDQFAVVITGYEKEIKQFISSNPGLKSRFTKYIHFDDYSPTELVDIFKKICIDYDVNPSDSACQYVLSHFTDVYDDRDETFSNGRRVRTLFEKSVYKQSNRVIRNGIKTKEGIMVMEKEDIDLSEK